MIYNYYVNLDSTRNPNHNHEVHKDGCIRMPDAVNRKANVPGYFWTL